jgi:hypothetical protein
MPNESIDRVRIAKFVQSLGLPLNDDYGDTLPGNGVLARRATWFSCDHYSSPAETIFTLVSVPPIIPAMVQNSNPVGGSFRDAQPFLTELQFRHQFCVSMGEPRRNRQSSASLVASTPVALQRPESGAGSS